MGRNRLRVVVLDDGIAALSFTDLPADNSGLPTGLVRSWTNGSGYSTGQYGSGMVFTQLPHLIQQSGGTIAAVANGTTVSTRLEAGWPVKVAVGQRYAG